MKVWAERPPASRPVDIPGRTDRNHVAGGVSGTLSSQWGQQSCGAPALLGQAGGQAGGERRDSTSGQAMAGSH